MTEFLSPSLAALHRAVKAYSIIFVMWGLYRLIFHFPEEIEETFLKPIVFIGAILFVERPKQVELFFIDIWGNGKWFSALLIGLVAGVFYLAFYAFSSILAFGKLELGQDVIGKDWIPFVGIGLATAVWEEWAFSGYLLKQFLVVFHEPWFARITTAFLFALVHVPILVFWDRFAPLVVLFQLVLLFILGVSNTILMGKTKNLLAPVLSHTFWGVAIFLFR